MANELIYTAIVKDGSLRITDRKGFDKDMSAYEGERLLVKVSKYQKDKSKEQRGYYRGVVLIEIMEGLVDIGYRRFEVSLDVVHCMLKEKFIAKEIVNPETGEFMKIIRSTEDLTMPEYAIFIQSCIDWAAEFLNILITPPRKQGILNFNK